MLILHKQGSTFGYYVHSLNLEAEVTLVILVWKLKELPHHMPVGELVPFPCDFVFPRAEQR